MTNSGLHTYLLENKLGDIILPCLLLLCTLHPCLPPTGFVSSQSMGAWGEVIERTNTLHRVGRSFPHIPKPHFYVGCDIPQSRQCASQAEESSAAILMIAISLKSALTVE